MASIFEKEPVFLQERPWSDTTKLPDKYKFSGKAGKAEVHIDSSFLWLEFFYEKTFPDFMHARTKLDWSWEEPFSKCENMLSGSYKTAWCEVLADNSTDLDALDEQNNRRFDHDKVSFRQAVGLFVCKILDSETPQDLQYVYMAPGGNHKIVKDLLMPPPEHARF